MAAFECRIRTKEDLKEAVGRFGFVPLFSNSISGFSVEEHVDPIAWFDSGVDGVWEWKGPVIRECGCAYGKFFERKAAFVSAEWFPDLANYRRDGYDFDARYDDGKAEWRDKQLYDLLTANAPILSTELKSLGEYGKGGKKGFDTILNRLQAQCYVCVSDFIYRRDRHGNRYGWGVAEYSTPEAAMGTVFTDTVYRRSPEESYERLLAHFRELLPGTEEKAIKKLLN